MYQKILEVRERVQGEHECGTRNTRYNLVASLALQGKHTEAQVLLCDMLKACTLAFGPDDPKTVQVWHKMCHYIEKRRTATACKHERQAADAEASRKRSKV